MRCRILGHPRDGRHVTTWPNGDHLERCGRCRAVLVDTRGTDALTEQDVQTLGRYNAERARGLQHSPEWQAEMARLQARFDRWQVDQSAPR